MMEKEKDERRQWDISSVLSKDLSSSKETWIVERNKTTKKERIVNYSEKKLYCGHEFEKGFLKEYLQNKTEDVASLCPLKCSESTTNVNTDNFGTVDQVVQGLDQEEKKSSGILTVKKIDSKEKTFEVSYIKGGVEQMIPNQSAYHTFEIRSDVKKAYEDLVFYFKGNPNKFGDIISRKNANPKLGEITQVKYVKNTFFGKSFFKKVVKEIHDFLKKREYIEANSILIQKKFKSEIENKGYQEIYVENILIQSLKKSNEYRKVIYTNKGGFQFELMTLKKGEDVDLERHDLHQTLYILQGKAKLEYGQKSTMLTTIEDINAGAILNIPKGWWHRITNASSDLSLKFFTLYSKQEHETDYVQETKDSIPYKGYLILLTVNQGNETKNQFWKVESLRDLRVVTQTIMYVWKVKTTNDAYEKTHKKVNELIEKHTEYEEIREYVNQTLFKDGMKFKEIDLKKK